MTAFYLQWRRFVFFDKETVKDAGDNGKNVVLPVGISACDSDRGHIILGDILSVIWFLTRSLQLSSFQLKQHSILVSVGQDEQGINPLVKIWNLDKRDSGNPLCTRIFPAIPGNKPTEVSCLTVHENLNFMAIGFTDGSVVLTKGDITRDRHSKTLTLHEGTCPITGLAFRQQGKVTHLFVATLEKVHCYTLTVKEYPKLELDTHGCALRCSVLTDPYQDSQFIVAGDECVYLYQPDERGPCFSPNKSEFGSREMSPSEKQTLTIYDLDNKFIAYSASFDNIIEVLAEWGSFYILTRDGKMFVLQEKDTQTKLEMLFKKNLFVIAINLAKSQHLERDGLSEIFRQYGDHLYVKGDHLYVKGDHVAIQPYIRLPVQSLQVGRQVVDPLSIQKLTYHVRGLKLPDRAEGREVAFSTDISWKTTAQAFGAAFCPHSVHILGSSSTPINYDEALRYIGRLPFEQAESNMKCCGKTLMHHVPDGTTLLLKGLCTDYQPSWDTTDRDRLDRGPVAANKANSEKFIPVFTNNPWELRAFLEPSPLRGCTTQEEGPAGGDNTVFDKALVLCQMHNFKEGVLYCEYQQIMHYHMQNEEYGKVVEACKRYGDQEVCLWEQALGYFARKEENCKAFISQVLQHIDQNNLMPPLLVVQTLAHNSTATLSVIKDDLINKLQRETQQIEDDERKIRQYREETAHLHTEIQELRSSAKIFQKTKCSIPLELLSVHFLCSHSFHQHYFESYAESEVECSTFTPENRKVMEMLRAQDQKRDLHDHLTRQLRSSNDGFSVVADYFGRGVFNKLTLVTDPPGSKAGSLEADLQRELLIHTKR
uniref:Vacuolar protein sorting-associated protein 11 homolog n=1 Tax=Salmo trutta TaxID=8032 RepID=A0A673WCP1_SALTR